MNDLTAQMDAPTALAREHAALLRQWAACQHRISQLVADYQQQLAQLQAQLMRLRAERMLLITQRQWELADEDRCRHRSFLSEEPALTMGAGFTQWI